MVKKLALCAAAVFSLAGLSPAAFNFDSPEAGSLKDEMSRAETNIPSPAPPGDAAAAKEWTVMVFINGKNNLESYALSDINEMEQVGSSDKVNIVVQAGRMGNFTQAGGWKGTRRYLVRKDSSTSTITSPVVQDMGKVDMGDYKSVINFGNWAKQNYPARKYALIIWNHGSGWTKSVKFGFDKGISYDDETKNHINTPQMAAILKEIGGVDVYGSDACLMQMVEVDYEIKDYAAYILGSEETEPNDGYNYGTFLAPLVADPLMSPEALAGAGVKSYGDHYQSAGKGSTQSGVKTAALPELLKAVDAFTAAIIKAGDKRAVQNAFNVAQSYYYSENKDLYHFTQLVVESTFSREVTDKGQALMNHITGALVTANRVTSSVDEDYSNSHGIAVYVPWLPPDEDYNELAWAKQSGWTGFIKWYQQKDGDGK